MGLFDSKIKTTSSVKIIRPTVVRTQNVAKELSGVAKSYDVEPNMLDFNILDVKSYIHQDDKETEWELVSTEALYELNVTTQLLNPNFHIKQTYEIEIFSKNREHGQIFKNMKIAVGANASKCKIYFSIAAGSYIIFDPTFEQEILLEIKKRKIRAGILIDIFDEMVADMVLKFTERLKKVKTLEFEKNETLLIAESYEPTATRNDALILHYEKSKKVDENEKIDYSSRDFIYGVKKDDLIIEYVKAKNGKPGRNCRGEYMKPAEPKISNEVTFLVDDTIRVEDSKESIKYYANENGYIAFENNTYIIKKEVNVNKISFKTTGSIRSGVDSDVNINVVEKDAIKDAIGTGMHVEVTEIEINGNVGSNAKVTAKKAFVGGQTHATATIRADNLDINVHKGKAYGKDIHITRLEHGEVYGEIVTIRQAVGGTIRAKEIDIELCASHVKAIATKRIEIKKLQGSENLFMIDPLLSKIEQSGFEENQEEIENLEEEIKLLKKDYAKHSKLVEEGTPAFIEIKKRLIHYKKNSVKMPKSFLNKYKEFQELQDELRLKKEALEKKLDLHTLQTTRTASFQDNIFDARVINRDRWVGYNEIKFKLIEPAIELVYKPKEGSKEKIFGLVDLGDGNYEIQAIKEEN